MGHYAKINEFNVVTDVIVAEQDFIDTLPDKDSWYKTSYNTKGGVHYGENGQPDGGVAFRKNYAGIGFTYDAQRDAFIPPQPYFSWILNEQSCLWEPPVPYPDYDKKYLWDEDDRRWILITDGVQQ